MSKFQKITKKETQSLLDKVLFKTFFHNLEWQDFLEKEFKWLKFEYYLYKDELLFILARVGKKLISLPFCEYGGPLPLKKVSDFDNFSKEALQEFKNIKIKIHPRILEFYEAKPRKGLRGLASDISTHWIEGLEKLNSEELFNSFRKTLRHSIRNAQKNNLEIRKCQNLVELKHFYNLYVATLKRKLTVPYPFELIKYLFERGSAEILLASYKKKIIAGNLFLHYNGTIHYFLSASEYKYRNLGASYLILWEKIKSLIGKTRPDGRGFVFDLGASPKGSALEIFKRGWGGKEYSILQLGIQRSEEGLRSSKLRKIWGLLPNWLIKKLSHFLIKYRI